MADDIVNDDNLRSEHGWYDSLKVIKTIEEHIREALRLSDSANLALSKELGDTLSSVVMSREAIEADDHFGEEQAADLKKELGTEGNHANETDTKDTGMSEQERELRDAILGGMREGPDSRF
ncbi:MAG: hypothetical protein J6Y02_03730 [Pseudobutyrivibrio sp.]|nr:hypothetical protein [Pseudobutyrivibrio sp.]